MKYDLFERTKFCFLKFSRNVHIFIWYTYTAYARYAMVNGERRVKNIGLRHGWFLYVLCIQAQTKSACFHKYILAYDFCCLSSFIESIIAAMNKMKIQRNVMLLHIFQHKNEKERWIIEIQTFLILLYQHNFQYTHTHTLKSKMYFSMSARGFLLLNTKKYKLH